MARGGPRPGSGRKKGSRDRKTEELSALIQSHALTEGYDPLVALAVAGNGQIRTTFDAFVSILEQLEPIKKPSEEVKQVIEICNSMVKVPVLGKETIVAASKEVAQYMYPKLRSVEISDPDGDNPFAKMVEALKSAAQSD